MVGYSKACVRRDKRPSSKLHKIRGGSGRETRSPTQKMHEVRSHTNDNKPVVISKGEKRRGETMSLTQRGSTPLPEELQQTGSKSVLSVAISIPRRNPNTYPHAEPPSHTKRLPTPASSPSASHRSLPPRLLRQQHQGLPALEHPHLL